MTRSSHTASRATRGSASPGFTLVELMAALTGGLIFSLAVFALSRDTSRFYQREARVADATLATVIGFERLRADIARAGFMVSPNIMDDPMFCRQPGAIGAWPGIMADMLSIRREEEGSTDGTDLIQSNLGRFPDSVVLTGNYTSVDDYDFVGVDACATAPVVSLRASSGGLARRGYTALDATARLALLGQLFPRGRVIRIVDEDRRQQYGIVDSVQAPAGNAVPTITLSDTPALRCRGGAATVCGLSARSNGTVNVVNFIRYSIRSLKDSEAAFAPLLSPQALTAPGEATRTELVREELDPLGEEPTPLSTELIAEYAVDLQLTMIRGQGTAGTPVTQLTATPLPASAPDAPQRIRAIRARLSLRSREPDRDIDVPSAASERAALGLSNAGLYRFGVGDEGTAPFARVRTLQADITLHNQLGIEW